jgi:subtilisin family serine protease
MQPVRHFCCSARRLIAPALLVAAAWVPAGLYAQPTVGNGIEERAHSRRNQPVPGPLPRLIVKFKEPMAQDLEAAMSPAGQAFPPRPARVQAWLDRHRLQTPRPLFPGALSKKLRSGESDAQAAARVRARFPERAKRVRELSEPPSVLRTYVLELKDHPRAEWPALLAELRADPDVVYAELEHVAQAQLTPNDPYFASHGSWGQGFDDLYGVKNIGCPAAWNQANGSGVVVAVIDTGIDYRHRDITNRVWINREEIPGNGIDDDDNGFVDDWHGWNFVGPSYSDPEPDNDPLDGVNGHGTHVAGTIAAQGNNNRGIIGVAWGAQVMAVRGLDDAGYGGNSTLSQAIVYAADNGADVINASWGGKGQSAVIEDAVNYAASLGVVFVAAAGNASLGNQPNDSASIYPGNLAAAIAVSAFTPNDGIASFSNFGYGLDVGAPGTDILSLRAANTSLGYPLNEEYTRSDGTSMAAPHVSGTAALILSRHPGYAPEEVRQVLRGSADRVMGGAFDPYSGYGRINASNALAFGPVLQARLLSPIKASTADLEVPISGIAMGQNFARYTLDYGLGDEPGAWTSLAQSQSPVDHAALGTLATAGLADGRYTIRLRAFSTSGKVFEDHVQIVVDYTFITSPAVPPVPSVAEVYKPGKVDITGSARSANFQRFRVEWARGYNATLGWTDAGVSLAGGGTQPVTNGLLASWNAGVVTQADYHTIRLVMMTPSFTNEASTVVYVEPDLYSTNWPRWLDQAPPYGSSALVVHDSSGSNVLTLANGDYLATDLPSRLWRFSLDGSSVTVLGLDHSYLQPAAANLDHTPGDETVVSERSDIRIIHTDGSSTIAERPLVSRFQYALPTLADLDGDGTPEILAWGSGPVESSAWIYAWKGDGRLFSTNYPLGPLPDFNFLPANRFLPVDLDGSGRPKLLVLVGDTQTSFSVRAFLADGRPASWPTLTFEGIVWQLAAGDLDGDGSPEILLALTDAGNTNWVYAFSANGEPRPGWPVQLQGSTPLRMIVADLDRDGRNEVIAVANATLDVLQGDGSHFPGLWPIIGNGFQPFGSPVAGDIDGDGIAEILTTRDNVVFSQGKVYRNPSLLAYRTNGQVARSWRLLGANGNQPHGDGNVVLGDFDNDGQVDLAVNYMLISGGGASGLLVEGVLSVFRLNAPFRPHPRDWPMNFHDGRNSAVGFVPATLRVTGRGNSVRLSWANRPEPAVVETCDDLDTGAWRTLTGLNSPIVRTNGMNTLTVSTNTTGRWYRLQYP